MHCLNISSTQYVLSKDNVVQLHEPNEIIIFFKL